MARSQPDTKPAHEVDEDLLSTLVKTVRPKGKCRFAAIVQDERPSLMPTFEEAIRRGVGGTVIVNTMRDLGLSVVNEKTVRQHGRQQCQCFRAGS